MLGFFKKNKMARINPPHPPKFRFFFFFPPSITGESGDVLDMTFTSLSNIDITWMVHGEKHTVVLGK